MRDGKWARPLSTEQVGRGRGRAAAARSKAGLLIERRACARNERARMIEFATAHGVFRLSLL
jgi:hypothetical protein